MSNTKDQGPLFFIKQPFSRNPANYHMQEIFRSKLEAEPAMEENIRTDESKKNVPHAKMEKDSNGMETQIREAASSIPVENNRSSFNRVKPFKEMTVKERLEYLINFPKVLPPVPCVFNIDDEKHLGYLISYEDNQITIEYHNKTQRTFPVDDITNVIMIGIKR